jgi:L-threonylcarbamoyladenylate synthase
MAAQLVSLDNLAQDRALDLCRDVVLSGGVIAYPTDTFYGLGVDPRNATAVERLFSIKGRSADQPILVLLGNQEEVAAWAARIPASAERLMARFWPGPLTLVFEARAEIASALTAGSGKIGLRVPGNPVTRALLNAVGSALTGTSANRSGGPSPRSAGDVLKELSESIDIVLDAGTSMEGLPSTIIDVTGKEPVVLRKGVITVPELLVREPILPVRAGSIRKEGP